MPWANNLANNLDERDISTATRVVRMLAEQLTASRAPADDGLADR
jgi:hypothetical protein